RGLVDAGGALAGACPSVAGCCCRGRLRRTFGACHLVPPNRRPAGEGPTADCAPATRYRRRETAQVHASFAGFGASPGGCSPTPADRTQCYAMPTSRFRTVVADDGEDMRELIVAALESSGSFTVVG